jgi:hypothetical protein
MTSIEWLEGQILNLMSFDTTDFRKEFREKVDQAKELHKKEIIDAYYLGDYSDTRIAEKYYQETFKSNK